MSRGKIDDRQLFRLIVEEGKTQQEAHREAGQGAPTEPARPPAPVVPELMTGPDAMAPMMDQASGRWVEGMLSGLDQVEAKIRTLGDALEDTFTSDNAPWVRSLADRLEDILAERLEQNR